MNGYAWEIKMKQKPNTRAQKCQTVLLTSWSDPKILKKCETLKTEFLKNQKKIINDYHK